MEDQLLLQVSKGRDGRGNPIAFFDPRVPRNSQLTYKHKDILKNHGAKFSKFFKNVFPPHKSFFWFFYMGPTEDKWRNNFDRYITPAIKEMYKAEGLTESDLAKNLERTLDVIVDKIKTLPPEFDGGEIIDNETKSRISNKIDEFKMFLMNIKDDEEFKNALKVIIEKKRLMGHEFSFLNTLLIQIQNPNAKVVKSKTTWRDIYNRTIKKDPKPIFLWKISSKGKRSLSKNEKEIEIKRFLEKEKLKSINDLGPGQKERLNLILSGVVVGKIFDLYPVYDISDTELIDGTEDVIQDVLDNTKELKWYKENELADEVRPIYTALIEYAEKNKIVIEFATQEELGGAKGVSYGGKIKLMHNKGNDVGVTKTFIHELAHEILHQKYLVDKDPKIKELFVGRDGGRPIIEQQAELTAWMVMAAFGFDVKTTSLNYVLLWGGDENNMIKVFDTISKAANYLISEIIARGGGNLNEYVSENSGKFSAFDVAKFAGVQDKYLEKRKEGIKTLNENFKRFI